MAVLVVECIPELVENVGLNKCLLVLYYFQVLLLEWFWVLMLLLLDIMLVEQFLLPQWFF